MKNNFLSLIIVFAITLTNCSCGESDVEVESHSNDIMLSIDDKKTKDSKVNQKEVIEVTTDDLESDIKPPIELQDEE